MNSSSVNFKVVFWSDLLNDKFIANNRYNNIDLIFLVSSHLAHPPVSGKLCINTLPSDSVVVRDHYLVFLLIKPFVFLSLEC